MDFELSEQQQALQDAARRFCQRELPAIAQQIENSGTPPDKALIGRYAEMGFLGVNIAEDYGGLGLGNLEALLVIEQFARVSSALAFPVFESCVGPIKVIEAYAQETLKQRVVPTVCRGETVVAMAMSEPAAGTALTDLQTRARVSGDSIVLNGSKRWCSGGGHADGYLVCARMDDRPGASGIASIYVDADATGVSFGAQERLMGFRGVPSADIYFDNVRVPIENLVLPAGGFGQLMEVFGLERCGNATMSLAQAAAALDDVQQYVQERVQFGRPVVDFQAVQMRLAEMRMQVDAARLLIQRAICGSGAGMPRPIDASMAKCYANEMARNVTGHAVQLMGAYGYAKDAPAERRFRDAWGWGIAGGTIDIQKINIASAMIGRRFNQRSV